MFQKKSALSLEWEKLQKKEKKFLQAREQKKDSLINQKLEEKVPAKLQSTLSKAFSKAFGSNFSEFITVISPKKFLFQLIQVHQLLNNF